MKVRDKFTIISNKKIAQDVYEMTLQGDTSAIQNPGEFVNVTIPGVYLPRPISIAYYDDKKLCLVYRVVGEGTSIMASLESKEDITLLTGLGNGFDLTVDTKKPLVIGGGMGVAPLYSLALKLNEKGISPTVLLGYKSKLETVYYEKFKEHFDTYIALEDSPAFMAKGYVTDILARYAVTDYDYFYACGPKPMLKAVNDITTTDGEFSLETRMACGIGQCKCCSIETNDGMKTLCKDGPVLKKGLIRW